MVNTSARKRLRYDITEIAYVEVVKCATRPLGSDLRKLFKGTGVLSRCWETHTRALLEELAPTHIVALWKPIIPMLRSLGYEFLSDESRIGAYNGSRSLNLDQRFADVVRVFDSHRSAGILQV